MSCCNWYIDFINCYSPILMAQVVIWSLRIKGYVRVCRRRESAPLRVSGWRSFLRQQGINWEIITRNKPPRHSNWWANELRVPFPGRMNKCLCFQTWVSVIEVGKEAWDLRCCVDRGCAKCQKYLWMCVCACVSEPAVEEKLEKRQSSACFNWGSWGGGMGQYRQKDWENIASSKRLRRYWCRRVRELIIEMFGFLVME